MGKLDLIATTAFGLEAVVKRELQALGYEGKSISPGWVQFQGDLAAICRTNLWLRTADRVLLRMASFEAKDFDALFETTKATAWDEWLARDAAFPVIGRSLKSQLSSVPACQRAVKKAVVESLLAAHRAAELPETGPQYKIEIALLKDQATLTIDTTGPSLHKRGYRLSASQAPLKETLAAALVTLSFWDRERPLIDPFCGSGTIPIEAALRGRNIAPGLNRSFSAEDWPNVSQDLWDQARGEARDLIEPELEERLIGTDIDERALRAARENAERAGVTDAIHFQHKPFESLTSKRKYGCVITNPPYGERLGEQGELEPLYHSIPEVLRRLPTWSHFILTAYPDFEARIQRTADRRRKLYNGRIECTYFQFHGPRPGDARSARVDSVGIDNVGIDNVGIDKVGIDNVGIDEVGREVGRWGECRWGECRRSDCRWDGWGRAERAPRHRYPGGSLRSTPATRLPITRVPVTGPRTKSDHNPQAGETKDRPRLRWHHGQRPRTSRVVSQPPEETCPSSAPLADTPRNHLLSSVRARHPRDPVDR